jgi:hypothetical protein
LFGVQKRNNRGEKGGMMWESVKKSLVIHFGGGVSRGNVYYFSSYEDWF